MSSIPLDLRPLLRHVDLSAEDQALARALLRRRELEGNQRIARAALLLCAATVPFTAAIALELDGPLALRLLFIVMAVALMEWAVLRRLQRRGACAWTPWLITGAEVSIPTAVMLADTTRLGPPYALTSSQTMLYAVVVMFSALRLQPVLCLAAGALGAVQSLGCYLALRGQLDPAQVAAFQSLSASNQFLRAAYVALTGVAASWVCQTLLQSTAELLQAVRQEVQTRTVLGTQVTRQVAEMLLTQGRAAGETQTITVLFSDIRGFTTLSEQRQPAEVVALLDRYFHAMCEVVDRHGGIVNKFLGDGMMALWGAPVPDAQHARHAADAALEMLAVVEQQRAAWGHPELEIGIGIHTGPAVVGLVGSRERCEYTAIGDTVNVAARIESLNKQHGTRLLASQDTAAFLGPGVTSRGVGSCTVKGRQAPVGVVELSPAEAQQG